MTRQQKHEISILAPTWELAALGCLAVSYVIIFPIHGSGTEWFTLAVGPILFTAIMATSCIQIMLRDAATLWTALFWYRLSSGLYFGLGNLMPFIVDEELVSFMRAFFDFTNSDVAKLNALVALGTLSLLLGSRVFLVLQPLRVARVGEPIPAQAKLVVGLLFLIIGFPIKYFLVVPNMFGLLEFVLPSSVALIGNFTISGLFLITVYALEDDRKYLPLAAVLLLMECSVGLLQMSKQTTLIPLLVFLLAVLRLRVSFRRLALAVIAVMVSYSVLNGVTTASRSGLVDSGNTHVNIVDRLSIVTNAFLNREEGGVSYFYLISAALVRLSYVNQSTFAIHLHDSGLPGDTLNKAYVVFIPRFLWPGKPEVTSIGWEFNALAKGSHATTSGASPTVIGEAYWNFGWASLLVIMLPVGLMLSLISRYALLVLRDQRWFLIPVLLIGVNIGHRTDGHIVPDLIGAPVIMFCAHIILRGVEYVVGIQRLSKRLFPLIAATRCRSPFNGRCSKGVASTLLVLLMQIKVTTSLW